MTLVMVAPIRLHQVGAGRRGSGFSAGGGPSVHHLVSRVPQFRAGREEAGPPASKGGIGEQAEDD